MSEMRKNLFSDYNSIEEDSNNSDNEEYNIKIKYDNVLTETVNKIKNKYPEAKIEIDTTDEFTDAIYITNLKYFKDNNIIKEAREYTGSLVVDELFEKDIYYISIIFNNDYNIYINEDNASDNKESINNLNLDIEENEEKEEIISNKENNNYYNYNINIGEAA